jgi:transcriptional regulator with XRE-family HTH domain
MTRLERERRRRGWNQTALAFHVGTTQSTVSLIERRRMLPTAALATRLARPLGLDSTSLLDEVSDTMPREQARAPQELVR